MQKKIFKITPLFIALLIVEFFLVCMTINGLFINNKGGSMLGGVIAGIGVAIFALIIVIQQSIANIKNIDRKILYIYEIIIIVVGLILVSINGISIG